MKKYLTLKNLGWVLTAIVSLMIGMSGISKIIGTQDQQLHIYEPFVLYGITWSH